MSEPEIIMQRFYNMKTPEDFYNVKLDASIFMMKLADGFIIKKNPYMNGTLPFETEIINRSLAFMTIDGMYGWVYRMHAFILDYYLPPWKDIFSGKYTGRVVTRDCNLVREWRSAVLERDKYTCMKCGSKSKLHAHHILHWSKCHSARTEVSNGVTLCETCHRKEHSNHII